MIPYPRKIMFYVLDVFVGALKYVLGGLRLWHALGFHLYVGVLFPAITKGDDISKRDFISVYSYFPDLLV